MPSELLCREGRCLSLGACTARSPAEEPAPVRAPVSATPQGHSRDLWEKILPAFNRAFSEHPTYSIFWTLPIWEQLPSSICFSSGGLRDLQPLNHMRAAGFQLGPNQALLSFHLEFSLYSRHLLLHRCSTGISSNPFCRGVGIFQKSKQNSQNRKGTT